MKIKKCFIVTGIALATLSAHADEVPGMVVQKTDGSRVELAISSISKITFADGQMVVNAKDDTQKMLSLDDISQISFCSIISAIEALTHNNSDATVVITNLSGQIVYKGPASSALLPASLKGVYVITVNGESHTVTIK